MELRSCEIEKLLQQLSALGTTDKDELIKGLQTVIGSDISEESANFFLELAGWNLHGAIGAYFDFGCENSTHGSTDSGGSVGEDRCVTTERTFNAQILYPTFGYSGDPFCLKVTVKNSGTAAWPDGSYICCETNRSVAPYVTVAFDSEHPLWFPIELEHRIPIASTPPLHTLNLRVNINPPSVEMAQVVGAFSFFLPNGERFGDILYCTAVLDPNTNTWSYTPGGPPSNPIMLPPNPMLMEL